MPVHDWTRVAAGIFHHFHHEWIGAIQHHLNHGAMPADYYALADQVTGGAHPDVLTLRGPGGFATGPTPGGGGTATLTRPSARFHTKSEASKYAKKTKQVVIRHVTGDAVVAVIELASPGNKGSAGEFRTFVEKASGLIRGGIHLLVADVFPPGPRDPNGVHAAIWDEIAGGGFVLPDDAPLTQVSYCAGVNEYEAFVEPVALGQPLPDLPLFLTPDFHVMLPLEATYQAAWAEVPARWQRVLAPQ